MHVRRMLSRTAIVALLLPASGAVADFSVDWTTIDCGGGASTSGDWVVTGTIGQADAAATLSAGPWQVTGGFWQSRVDTNPPCPGDADGDGDVDLTDLSLLLSEFGMSGPGLAGDVDGSGNVDLTDLSILLGNFGLMCA